MALYRRHQHLKFVSRGDIQIETGPGQNSNHPQPHPDLLATMDGWKPLFVLLLPACVCIDKRVSLVKTIDGDSDITPVCSSVNVGAVLLVKCLISTKTHLPDGCHLLYSVKQLDNKCDSRFTLLYTNHSVFINLTSLTPMDSGNYTCECSYERGTHSIHIHITVEAGGDKGTFSGTRVIAAVFVAAFGVSVLIVSAGIICDRILGREGITSGSFKGSERTRSETPRFLDQDDHYASLQHPSSDIYETISSRHQNHYPEEYLTYTFNNQETDEKEKDLDSNYAIYETVFN